MEDRQQHGSPAVVAEARLGEPLGRAAQKISRRTAVFAEILRLPYDGHDVNRTIDREVGVVEKERERERKEM